ncbi:lymphocyte expansion molecule [Biomphalaria glabrata]
MTTTTILSYKRFKGAPFGTQTARFDVSGVHPKCKTAGGYTEIPYDRNYIDELNICPCVPKENCLQRSTRGESYATKGSNVETIKNISNLTKSTLSKLNLPKSKKWEVDYIKDSVVDRKIIDLRNKLHCFRNTCNVGSNEIFFTENVLLSKKHNAESFNGPKDSIIQRSDQLFYLAAGLQINLNRSKKSDGNSNASIAQILLNRNENSNPTDSKPGEEDDDESILFKGTDDVSDRSRSLNQSEQSESSDHEESQSVINREETRTSQNSIPIIEVEDISAPLKSALSKTKKLEESSKRVSFESQLTTDHVEDSKQHASITLSSRPSLDENVLFDTERRRSSVRFLIQRKLSLTDKIDVKVDDDIIKRTSIIFSSKRNSELEEAELSKLSSCYESDSTRHSLPELEDFAKSYVNELVVGIKKSWNDLDYTGRALTYLEEPQSHTSRKVSESEGFHTDTTVSHGSLNKQDSKGTSSTSIHYKSSTDSSTDVKEEEILQLFNEDSRLDVPPNSSCQLEEFVSQSNKRKKEKLLKAPYESCEAYLKRKLGPGVYNLMISIDEDKKVEEQAPKTGWARQLELERLAALPHLLYKEQWEEKKMLQKKLGPGSYNIKDFIQINNAKPHSGRGICENLAPRFENKHMSATPGPGTYGIDGIPQKAMDEKAKKSASTKGILDAGDRKRNLPSIGSHLGPGTYNHTSCTEQLLNKVTGIKGPYNLFSLERDAKTVIGHHAIVRPANLGPGQYDVKSFVDELNNEHKRSHGRFAKVDQYPDTFLQDFPGPGIYDVKQHNSKCSHGVNIPGFLSSAKRDDKLSQKFFTGNYNPVGAGRYDVQKYEEAQDVNGCTSSFKSRTNRPNQKLSRFLQERLRAKDISPADKAKYMDPYRMTRSITIM